MSLETEPARRAARPAPELELERDVDFGRYARTILLYWWLPVAGLVVGAALGFVLARADGSVYQAQAIVYLGQPLSASGGSTVSGVGAEASSASSIAKSQEVVEEVAGEVGIPAAKLRRSVSTSILGERTPRNTTASLVGVSVRGSSLEKTERAANMIAAAFVARLSGYADAKINTFEQRLAAQEREIESAERQVDELSTAIQREQGLTSGERLSLTSLIAVFEQRRAALADERLQTEQLLAQSREVERPRVVTGAAASKVNARSSRTSAVVGGFIGLIAGILAALLWEPVARFRSAA
jgi:capsular polysaccharide biosynthesis protein